MSVYTRPSLPELSAWLATYPLGTLRGLADIAEGVQNSNFYLDTTTGQYVLTLLEQADCCAIDFHVRLLDHLSRCGIPCPTPLANRHDRRVTRLAGRPAIIVARLPGTAVPAPASAHCRAAGTLLAELHLAAATCPTALPHARDAEWCARVAQEIGGHLSDDDALLLADELAHQQRYRPRNLPRGTIHADLFRDNVLFVADQVSGVLDFYFAGVDDWLFDLAVTVNDWCTTENGEVDGERSAALLTAYDARRPLLASERAAWPTLLRAAALRFWVSRLQDHHRPRSGALVTLRDPSVFRSILLARRAAAGAEPSVSAARVVH